MFNSFTSVFTILLSITLVLTILLPEYEAKSPSNGKPNDSNGKPNSNNGGSTTIIGSGRGSGKHKGRCLTACPNSETHINMNYIIEMSLRLLSAQHTFSFRSDVPGLEPVTLHSQVATINTPQIQFNGSFPEKFSYDTKVEVVMDDNKVVITDYCDYSECTGTECDCHITVDYTEQEQQAHTGASAPGPRIPGATYVRFAINTAKSVVQYFGYLRN
ncbi:hypothetical protein DdX_21550 [Ditylenchus destructor]|uniref:Uncharacterized protein n=1 Tax=Ditylenchus destructor TaxID=166010 RepID=A0AAD4MFD4_9BILA|nr:hypothetical protein DdX_21550 [Ditylenchus destructor]